jgi:hypothetical protein
MWTAQNSCGKRKEKICGILSIAPHTPMKMALRNTTDVTNI